MGRFSNQTVGETNLDWKRKPLRDMTREQREEYLGSHYYDHPTSNPSTNATLSWPRPDPRITSGFGEPRTKNGMTYPHSGIDIAGGMNAPVLSTRDGTVVDVGTDTRGNNYLIIEDTDGYRHGYFHVSTRLKPGDTVRMQEEIAKIDNSGTSKGPHVHYKIADPAGAPVDPQEYLRNNRAQKPREHP